MRLLALATAATLLLSGCGAYGAGAPLPAKRPQGAPQAQARDLAERWLMNDGLIMNEDEERVFALLPRALKPTPTTPNNYRNLVSNFQVRKGPANPRFWSFSGVRLVAQSLFVPTHPSFEWFFSGSFDSQTGEVTIYRETLMATHQPDRRR